MFAWIARRRRMSPRRDLASVDDDGLVVLVG